MYINAELVLRSQYPACAPHPFSISSELSGWVVADSTALRCVCRIPFLSDLSTAHLMNYSLTFLAFFSLRLCLALLTHSSPEPTQWASWFCGDTRGGGRWHKDGAGREMGGPQGARLSKKKTKRTTALCNFNANALISTWWYLLSLTPVRHFMVKRDDPYSIHFHFPGIPIIQHPGKNGVPDFFFSFLLIHIKKKNCSLNVSAFVQKLQIVNVMFVICVKCPTCFLSQGQSNIPSYVILFCETNTFRVPFPPSSELTCNMKNKKIGTPSSESWRTASDPYKSNMS